MLPWPALLIVLVLAGCGAPAPTASGPVERFLGRLHDPDLNLAAGIRGSYALSAEQAYPVWGALAFDGPDSRLVTAMEGPLGIDAWEQIVHEGTIAERSGASAWQAPVDLAEATDVLRTSLVAVASADLVSSEVVDGRTLHHVRAGGLSFGPEAFGIGASGDQSATLDAWV